MKKFPFVLVLLLALGTLAKAEPDMSDVFNEPEVSEELAPVVWLLMRFGAVIKGGGSLEAIPMADMDQCEMSGAEFLASKRLWPDGDARGYECLEGVR